MIPKSGVIFLKVFHELGHAFTAQRFGARVPVMGVAVMMMMPMLYTDVTDAWRLASKRERLLIGAAGMLTEFAIAGLALFVWAFLADGPARSAAFFLATTAWIGSLAVNLSPFMRFDGYHLLADALEVPNLGPRSFALARWRLREALFGLGDPPPEQLGAALRRTLIGYAWFTWIYRLLLFTGIALLVYYAFPKVLGIPLFVIEIVFFIARPVMKELQEWHGRRREIAGQRRAWAILGVLIVVAALAALPLDRHVSVPAVLMAGAEWRAFAPEPAQVRKVRVRPGQIVAAGEVLAELTSPELDAETARAQLRLDIAEARLQRIAADARDRALMSVLERERLALRQSIAGLAGRRALLTLRSPIAGVVDRMAEGLQPGAWVGRKSPLFEVIGQGPPVLRGLADEAGIARIGPAAIGSFIPEDAQVPAIPARLQTIGAARGAGPELLLLASIHGGAIAATSDVNRQPVAKAGVFPITAEAGATPPRRMIRGTLILEAEPASFAGLAAKRILSVLLRESGF